MAEVYRTGVGDPRHLVARSGTGARRKGVDMTKTGFQRSAIGVLAVALASLVLSAQTNQLRLVSTPWPPFTNEPGQSRFALDLVEAALSRIGVTSRTTIVDAAKFTPSLLNGPFDGSAAVWKDPERDRVLLFSQPYLENRLILVGRTGAEVSAATLADLKGKRVGIVEGYSYGEAIDNLGITFVRARSEEDSLRQLLGGDVDYVLMDEIVVQYIVDHHSDEARTKLHFGTASLLTRPLYLAVRRAHPAAQSIVDRFNAQIRAMIADRTYHRLLHVDWIRADVDGDGLAEYVSRSDRPGPSEPERAYTLFSSGEPEPQPRAGQKRYLFGGSVYSDWAAVPEKYKNYDPQRPEPGIATAPIYKFTW
jgi:polar amino acid transport system substrate-binding protein